MNNLLSILCISLLLGSSTLYARGGDSGDKDRYRAKMEQKLSGLPEQKAILVKDTLKKMHTNRKAMKDQMRQQHDKIQEVLVAEQFDQQAFLSYSEQLQGLKAQIHLENSKIIADLASQLTADERKVLADVLPHHGKKGKKRGGWR